MRSQLCKIDIGPGNESKGSDATSSCRISDSNETLIYVRELRASSRMG